MVNERMRGIPRTDAIRVAQHFGILEEYVTEEYIMALPIRGYGLEVERAAGGLPRTDVGPQLLDRVIFNMGSPNLGLEQLSNPAVLVHSWKGTIVETVLAAAQFWVGLDNFYNWATGKFDIPMTGAPPSVPVEQKVGFRVFAGRAYEARYSWAYFILRIYAPDGLKIAELKTSPAYLEFGPGPLESITAQGMKVGIYIGEAIMYAGSWNVGPWVLVNTWQGNIGEVLAPVPAGEIVAISFYNPFTAAYEAAYPTKVPIGNNIGFYIQARNTVAFSQNLTTRLVIIDPAGAQVQEKIDTFSRVPMGGDIISGKCTVQAFLAGTYTGVAELYGEYVP